VLISIVAVIIVLIVIVAIYGDRHNINIHTANTYIQCNTQRNTQRNIQIGPKNSFSWVLISIVAVIIVLIVIVAIYVIIKSGDNILLESKKSLKNDRTGNNGDMSFSDDDDMDIDDEPEAAIDTSEPPPPPPAADDTRVGDKQLQHAYPDEGKISSPLPPPRNPPVAPPPSSSVASNTSLSNSDHPSTEHHTTTTQHNHGEMDDDEVDDGVRLKLVEEDFRNDDAVVHDIHDTLDATEERKFEDEELEVMVGKIGPPPPVSSFTNKFKIFITFLQICYNFTSKLDFQWPSTYKQVMAYLGFSNLDYIFQNLTGTDCISQNNYYIVTLALLIIPIIITVLGLLLWVLPRSMRSVL
jgi:hypothetical protein